MSAKLLVFGSGRGSNFISIYKQIKAATLDAKITAVFSDKKDAKILDFAKKNSIATEIVNSENILNNIEKYQPDFIILAGFLKKIPSAVISKYPNKIINIHPSLLPLFGGKGMYGQNVHRAVKNAGVKISGATVHFVNEVYDDGMIILQESVELSGYESAEEIAEKVLQVEHKLFPRALNYILSGDFQIDGNCVKIGKRT